MKTAKKGYLSIVKFLVENGANINQINLKGENALMLIASNNNIEGTKFLIENGAKIECINSSWEWINKMKSEVKEYLHSCFLNVNKNEINSPNFSNQPITKNQLY